VAVAATYQAQRVVAWLAMGATGTVRSRRTPGGEVRYYLDFRPHGRVWALPTELGPVPLTDAALAHRLLEQIRGRVAGGEALEGVLDGLRRGARSHVLRRATDWLAAKAAEAEAGQLSPASVEEMRSHVRHHWTYWEGVSVHEIVHKGQLDDWRARLLTALSPSTTRNVLALFRSFLQWLEDRGEIRQRLPRFPAVAVPERVPRLLTQAQQERVLEAIPARQRGLYVVLVDLALRPGEARALRRSDYDPEVRTLTVQRAAKGDGAAAPVRGTKTGRVRRLPVTERVHEALTAPSAVVGGLAFPGRAGMLSHSAVQRAWAAASRAAGVPVVPVREGTRHSTATRLRREDVRLDVIQRLLGHTSPQHTERYARFHDAALVAALSPDRKRVRK